PPPVQVPPPGAPVAVEPEQPPLRGHAAEVLAGERFAGMAAGDAIGAGGLNDLHPAPAVLVGGGELVIAATAGAHPYRPGGGEELKGQCGPAFRPLPHPALRHLDALPHSPAGAGLREGVLAPLR